MSHRVYTGSFAALERRWLDEVGRLQQGDPLRPVTVLVGSNVLASYLKVLLARELGAAANVRFLTFLDLATSLARYEAPARPRLPSLGGVTLLDELLDRDVPEAFRKVASYSGFRANLLDTFRDLRDAGIGAADLDRSLPELKRRMSDREGHLNAFASLYRGFRARVERFHDIDDDFRSAIRNARRAAEAIGGRLLVYGIYDATGQQEDLLAALSEAIELIYCIPFVDASESRFASYFLEARCRELKIAPEPVDVPARATSLGWLSGAGFGFRPGPTAGPVSDDGTIRLVSAPGESRAAVEIVREVLAAVRDRAAAGFHEIAVLLRHPREDAPIVAEALRLRGIPHFIHGGAPFEERPLCRAVVAFAGLEEEGFPRAGVLGAMEFLAAALPPSSARAWDAQQYRALTNDAGFLSGIKGWDAGTDAVVRRAASDCERAESGEGSDDEQPPPSPARARIVLERAQSLGTAWRAVRDAAAGWPAAETWSGWATLLEERLAPLLDQAGDWQAFCSVFDEIRSLGTLHERRRIPRGRMLSLLKESISGRSRSEGRFLRSGVNLLPLSMARGVRFPVVIVPGLEEGAFPARPRQDPLLLDRERAILGGLFSKLPLKARRREEETLLFTMAARSAEKRLVLVTSRLDERTDRERIPSEFFLRVAEASGGSAITLRDLREGALPGFRSVSLENPAPKEGEIAIDDGEIRLRLITRDRKVSRAVLRALAVVQPELLEKSMAFDRGRWRRELTEFDGRILDPELTRWIAARIGPAAGQVSATRLEEFARCPYLFYLGRAVGLEPWEEPEPGEGLDALSRGSAVHALLENFVRERGPGLFADPASGLEDDLFARARRALDSERPPGIPDLLWELEQEATERVLRRWIAFERERAGSGLAPRLVEYTFGALRGEAPRPAYRLEAGRHTFEFRGKIDRVDFSGDGRRARVIDYKTGNAPRNMMRWRGRPILMGGEKIQIAIYRGALEASFPDAEEVSGEYLHLQWKDGRVVTCTFDPQALREGTERLGAILEIIGDCLEAGIFFARTEGSVYANNCTFCGYLPVCGKDVERRAGLKSGDASVRKFERLVEIDDPWECE